VLLVGEPGSGKTELGLALARALAVPFLSRDQVRRGLYMTAGAWDGAPGHAPTAERAVEAFLTVVETMARLGIGCVVEYVFRAARTELKRLTDIADCVVVRTSCADAPARRAGRDGEDELLARPEVVRALGHRDAAEAEATRAARMAQVTEEMMTRFPLPLLEVATDDGWDPPLGSVVEFATKRSMS
jgi:predicted kinase